MVGSGDSWHKALSVSDISHFLSGYLEPTRNLSPECIQNSYKS